MTFLKRELQSAGIPFAEACPLAAYSTFRIGGNADLVVFPETPEALTLAATLCRRASVPFFLVGNGSNLLFSDRGLRGAVLFTRRLNQITILQHGLLAQCGATLPALSRAAQKRGLAGLEFACGIPGTLGGAVVMNAGAHGGEMAQVVTKTVFFNLQTGGVETLRGKAHAFGYRTGAFAKHPEWIILGACLRLQPGNPESIDAKMKQNLAARRAAQPVELPSAGSAFKRPPNGTAAGLIDRCGLKGYAIGGAMVSPKHAGFLVNTGNATAADVWNLIQYVRETVLQKTGILLEPEIQFLGEMI